MQRKFRKRKISDAERVARFYGEVSPQGELLWRLGLKIGQSHRGVGIICLLLATAVTANKI